MPYSIKLNGENHERNFRIYAKNDIFILKIHPPRKTFELSQNDEIIKVPQYYRPKNNFKYNNFFFNIL